MYHSEGMINHATKFIMYIREYLRISIVHCVLLMHRGKIYQIDLKILELQIVSLPPIGRAWEVTGADEKDGFVV